jgi:hypothetical protein
MLETVCSRKNATKLAVKVWQIRNRRQICLQITVRKINSRRSEKHEISIKFVVDIVRRSLDGSFVGEEFSQLSHVARYEL